MKMYICNAFSLSMLDREMQRETPLIPRPLDERDAKAMVEGYRLMGWDVASAVGHADTAELFGRVLGLKLDPNRMNVKLNAETALLIGQYVGPRLPEGATTLPEGATIEWWTITRR